MNASEKKLIRKIRKAINDFGMIDKGDKIILGVSGGKDSMALGYLINKYNNIIKEKFTIIPVYISKDFLGEDIIQFKEKKDFFKNQLNLELLKIEIKLPNNSKLMEGLGKNCQRCAYARRIALMKTCQKFGANKIMLGHHMDDIVVTTYINMIEGRKLKIMPPINKMKKGDITFIRPLSYIREKEIENFVFRNTIPYSSYKCPIGEDTIRNKIKKNIIRANEKLISKYTENIFWSFIKNFKEKYEKNGYNI